MFNKNINSNKIGLLALLTSSSTLICCALPSLFIAIGAGATLASVVNFFPQLIIISKYKIYISAFTLMILTIAGWIIHKVKYMPCPIDEDLRNACLKTRKQSRVLYLLSLMIFISASFFTYILPLYL